MILAALALFVALPASGFTPLPAVSSGAVDANFLELASEVRRQSIKDGGVVNQHVKFSSSIAVSGNAFLNGPTRARSTLTLDSDMVGPQVVQVWAHFVGTGTVVILDSVGVSSVTDLGAGSWRVNFSTPFASNRYSTQCTTQRAVGGVRQCFIGNGVNPVASAVDVYVSDETTGLVDVDQLNVWAVGRR